MIELTVTGMTCGGCVKSVEKAVKRTDETAAVTVDLASGSVTIDSSKPAEAFKSAIEAAGYEVAA
ncbi:heavy-metal-associated domain-containing protein [Chthonobacter rhizosphaerae]|uniref:heavy-metal-associated domain-containing protein n=1 Tax=Chthonobacter rhizosphaerae TaxID=2735553 RepID=UPI0015EF5B13|nr:cation transporter [Chthonobacter rhizosphaerae]